MRSILFLSLLILIGCEGASDTSDDASQSNRPPNPDWKLPAGDHKLEDSGPPTVFVASIGGFSGQSFKIELNDDGNLVYLQNPSGFTEWGGTSEEIMVTEEMWNEFRDRLNRAEVWKWQRRYDDPKVADGTVWKLKIEYTDQTIASSGSNAYPKEEHFKTFLDAVSELADGKPFD